MELKHASIVLTHFLLKINYFKILIKTVLNEPISTLNKSSLAFTGIKIKFAFNYFNNCINP